MAWKRIGEGKRESERGVERAPAETNNRTPEERDNDEGEQKERTRAKRKKRGKHEVVDTRIENIGRRIGERTLVSLNSTASASPLPSPSPTNVLRQRHHHRPRAGVPR